MNYNSFKAHPLFLPSHLHCLPLFSTSLFCTFIVLLFCDSLSLNRAFCVIISLELSIGVWWAQWLSLPRISSQYNSSSGGSKAPGAPCPFMAIDRCGIVQAHCTKPQLLWVLLLYWLCHAALFPIFLLVHSFHHVFWCSLSLRGGGIMSCLGLYISYSFN